MAKKAAAKIPAADVKPTASGPGVGPIGLDGAVSSIADACRTLPAIAIVTSQVRTLRMLCDAAEGDAQAAPAVAAIRGGFAHKGQLGYVPCRVGDLQAVKDAIDRKGLKVDAPTAAPPSDASGSAAAA